MMQLEGSEQELLKSFPGMRPILQRSGHIPRQIRPYQAAALYTLMRPYNQVGKVLLDIGTRAGYSASILAQAAPRAQVITLERYTSLASKARRHLRDFPNVQVVEAISWEFLAEYPGPLLSGVFVDGDHKHCRRDTPWYEFLEPGGLIMFHDYSPGREPCVVAAVNSLCKDLGREPGVRIIDSAGLGMAGVYKL